MSLESFRSAFAYVPVSCFIQSQASDPRLSLHAPASAGHAVTGPLTAGKLSSGGSRLAVVRFVLPASSGHFLSHPADRITGSHGKAEQRGCVTRLRLNNTVSFAARRPRCRPLQRTDASAWTEPQVLLSDSCGAVRRGAMVSQIIERDKSVSSKRLSLFIDSGIVLWRSYATP